MALKRHRRMRANPVELLVVNPGRPGMSARHNPEWARSIGRGLYRGTRYAAESARDLYHGAREAHRAHRAAPGAAVPTMNPGRKPKKKRKNPVALPKRDRHGKFVKKVRLKKAKKKAAKKAAKKHAAKHAAKKAAPARRRRRRKAKANPMKLHRRRRRHALKANPAKRRRRRKAKANPVKMNPRRRRRARKANPAKRRHRRNPLSKKFIARAKRRVATLKKRRKKAPARSLRRRALSAQVRRAGAILSLARSRSSAKKIRPAIRGLQHAMMTRSNPGFAGVVSAAKLLAPQAAVGGLGLVALAMAGKYVGDMVVMEKDVSGTLKPRKAFADEKDPMKASMLGKYVPALSTAGLSVVGYMVADKVAPRYKGAVMIGGMIGAIVQAVMASIEPGKDTWASKVQAALLPIPGVKAADQSAATTAAAEAPAKMGGFGEYTTVGGGIFHGLGEYTTVGGGGDNRTEFAADSLRGGIFHGFGEYTTVGGGADNATEFAADSLRGLDDASEFAPGEGGVLSGGIFK